jgi:hypothetical protein
MFSAITNVYNKKTNEPTFLEFSTATEKLKRFFWQIEIFDVCTTGNTAHIVHLSLQKQNFSVFLRLWKISWR